MFNNILKPQFISQIEPYGFRAKIAASYVITLAIMALLFILATIDISSGQIVLGLMIYGIVASLGIVLLLFKIKQYNLARIALIGIMSLSCMSFYFPFGRSYDNTYLFIGPIALSYLVHTRHEIKQIIISSLIAYGFLMISFFIIGNNFKTQTNSEIGAFFGGLIVTIGIQVTIHFLKRDEVNAIKEHDHKSKALENFKAAISGSSPMVIFNKKGEIIEENFLFENIFNGKEAKNLSEVLHELRSEVTFSTIISTLEATVNWKGEIAFIHDGDFFWFQGIASKIDDDFILTL